jgi:hypothetical protein
VKADVVRAVPYFFKNLLDFYLINGIFQYILNLKGAIYSSVLVKVFKQTLNIKISSDRIVEIHIQSRIRGQLSRSEKEH